VEWRERVSAREAEVLAAIRGHQSNAQIAARLHLSVRTVEWLGDAFVVFRWTMGGDAGKTTSEMVLVLGRSDAQDTYTALYHDERGVCRVYAMTFDGSQWNLGREDSDMFQRFVADVGPDRIAGRWEASEDYGSTWRKDFDLVFERR
jgi:hypothetical protein